MVNDSLNQFVSGNTINVPTLGTTFPVQGNTVTMMTVTPSPVRTPGMFDSILAWLNFNPLHWAMGVFGIILLLQVIQNFRRKESRLGIPTSLGLLTLSVWGVWVNYNAWLGGIYALLSLCLVVESARYNGNNSKEVVEQTQPIQQPQRQIPIQVPIRQPPVSMGVWDNFQPPRIGLFNWDL